MARCATCGNEYHRAFRVITASGGQAWFDSFECAIHRLAPACANCGQRVIGHGVEIADGTVFCCAHCARAHGHFELVDRPGAAADPAELDQRPTDEEVDMAVEDTFPASDSPSFWARNL